MWAALYAAVEIQKAVGLYAYFTRKHIVYFLTL